MAKIKEYWNKALAYVAAHPKTALIVTLALIALVLYKC